jgi:hypothetical protein
MTSELGREVSHLVRALGRGTYILVDKLIVQREDKVNSKDSSDHYGVDWKHGRKLPEQSRSEKDEQVIICVALVSRVRRNNLIVLARLDRRVFFLRLWLLAHRLFLQIPW